MKLSRFTVFGILGIFLGLTGTETHAYVPPSQFLIKNMCKKKDGFKSVLWKSWVRDPAGNRDSGTKFRQVSYYDFKTRLLASRAYDSQGRLLLELQRRLPVASKADNEAYSPAVTSDLVLLSPSSGPVLRNLKSRGLPVRLEEELQLMTTEEERIQSEMTSLARLGSQPVWTVRANRKDWDQPQLWLEKDTFLPLKLTFRNDGTWMTWSFEKYRFFQEFPFPRLISLYEGSSEEPWLQDELIELEVNPKTPPKAVAKAEWTPQGKQADSDLRKLIEKYYRWVR